MSHILHLGMGFVHSKMGFNEEKGNILPFSGGEIHRFSREFEDFVGIFNG